MDDIVCVDKSLGIYISESGLSASDCQNLMNVADFCASNKGGWSSYTYAKQTLGCRENDQLAFVSAKPVMTACATIRKHLMKEGGVDSNGRAAKELVLDEREPHVVKYDTTLVERQKLDLHTDKR